MADKPGLPPRRDDEPSLVPSFLHHEAGSSLPPRQTFEELRTLGRRRRARSAVLASLALLLFVGVLGGAWLWWNARAPSTVAVAEPTPLAAPVIVASPTRALATLAAAAPVTLPPPPARQPRDTPSALVAAPTTPTATPPTPAPNEPSPPPMPSPGPTQTPTLSSAAATQAAQPPPPLARPNGPVIRAPRVNGQGATSVEDMTQRMTAAGVEPIAVEAPVFGANAWSGSRDLSGLLWVGWDNANLYLLTRVYDDVFVQESSGILLYQGDSVELQLDADLAGDFTSRVYSDDDWQIDFSPGNLLSANPVWQWWVYRGIPGSGNVTLLTARHTDGYSLAATIPWSLLRVTPRAGNVYGFAFNISDNDTPGTQQQESMVSTSPVRQLNDPTSWGTLQLVDR